LYGMIDEPEEKEQDGNVWYYWSYWRH
jgi:hypothetical protein